MPLSAGDTLGPYEILAPIGKGGMGEVFRAHDPRTGRDVAIKISAERFSERFDREVRAVAALNHPNICTLYDVGPDYLVMEFIEGEAPKGPLPLDEALRIARQIADALEAAHDKGITHRDLKPGNIKIKSDGTVKVLDFGLAKIEPASAVSQSENSPTLSMAATQMGMILGTAAYMAPEQAKGKPVDKRADIWAFGVVLHELLTGELLFQHDDVTETLAAVVMKVPEVERAPYEVRRLLKKCLEKDPKKRLRDMGDVWELLDAPGESGTEVPVQPQPGLSQSRLGKLWPIVAVLFALVAGAVSFIHFREQAPPAELVRLQVPLPENTTLGGWAPMSPNGRMVAFQTQDRDGRRRLWVRPLDVLQARAVADVNSANTLPFWSPDSRSLAYYSDGKLKKVDVAGGPPVNLCDIKETFRGGSWSPEGTIIYGTQQTGLFRVSQAGGVPIALTNLDAARVEAFHDHPFFLPDGRHFLYLRRSGSTEREGIYIGSLDNSPEKQPSERLLAAKTQSEYAASPGAASGHLLFLRDSTLMAQPFDPAKLLLSGDPVPVADPLLINGDYAYFSASAGTSSALSYFTGTAVQAQLTWFDRTGKPGSKPGEPVVSTDVTISPDGSQAAVVRNGDIWVLEFARNSSSRLTSDPAAEDAPVWSPDGKRIVFRSARVGGEGISIKVANGATPEEQILKSSTPLTPTSWSRDGKYLLYTSVDPKTKADIWTLSAPGSASSGPDAGKPKPFLQTADSEGQARFSPDGKWVVYTSDESGAGEVYVRSFPDAGNKVKISTGNGNEPHWSVDGKEIFYRHNRQVMAVPVTLGSVLQAGSPKQLFEATITGAGNIDRHPNFVISPDGKQFLALASGEANNSEPITVLLNWQAVLKK